MCDTGLASMWDAPAPAQHAHGWAMHAPAPASWLAQQQQLLQQQLHMQRQHLLMQQQQALSAERRHAWSAAAGQQGMMMMPPAAAPVGDIAISSSFTQRQVTVSDKAPPLNPGPLLDVCSKVSELHEDLL